jgi:hypothetical protein
VVTFFFVVLGILKVSCSCFVAESAAPALLTGGGGGRDDTAGSLSAFLLLTLVLEEPSGALSAALPSAALSFSRSSWGAAFLEEEAFVLDTFFVLVPLSASGGGGGGGGEGEGGLSDQQGK